MSKHVQKKSYKLTKEEIETNITIDYIDNSAFVYTNHKPTIRKLEKIISSHPEDAKEIKQDDISLSVIIPRNWIKFSAPGKRKITDEEVRQMVQRLKESHQL